MTPLKVLFLAALLALPLPAFSETRDERVAAAQEYYRGTVPALAMAAE